MKAEPKTHKFVSVKTREFSATTATPSQSLMKNSSRQSKGSPDSPGRQTEIAAKTSWLERPVSHWKHKEATSADVTLTFREWIKRIQTKQLLNHKKIRELLTKELAERDSSKREQLKKQRQSIKDQLPAITPCGMFAGRRTKGKVAQSSGMQVIDIDLKDNRGLNPAHVKQQVLKAHEKNGVVPWSIGLVTESPSRGVKLLVEGEYGAACAVVRELLPGLVIEESDEDNRLCFDPYDPEPLVFEHTTPAKPLPKPEPLPKPTPQPSLVMEDDLACARRLAQQWLRSVGEFQKDEKRVWFANCECPFGHTDSRLYFNDRGVPNIWCADQDNRRCAQANELLNDWFKREWPLRGVIIERFEFDDLMAFVPSEDPDRLVGERRWLVRGSSLLIAGPSGTGKSTLLIQIVVYWANGFPIFGIKTMRPLRTLIIESEDNFGDTAEMLQGSLQGIQRNEPNIDIEKLHSTTKENVIIRKIRGAKGKVFCRVLRRLIDEEKPDFVWINPLFAYAGSDLMNFKETGAFLRDELIPIGDETGVCIGAIHHAGKTERDSKARSHWTIEDQQYLAIGVSEIQNPFRAICALIPTNQQAKDGRSIYKFILSKRGERAGAREPLWEEPIREVFLVKATDGTLFWSQIETPTPVKKPEKPEPGRHRSAELGEFLGALEGKLLKLAEWTKCFNAQRRKQKKKTISTPTAKRYRKELVELGDVEADGAGRYYQVTNASPDGGSK